MPSFGYQHQQLHGHRNGRDPASPTSAYEMLCPSTSSHVWCMPLYLLVWQGKVYGPAGPPQPSYDFGIRLFHDMIGLPQSLSWWVETPGGRVMVASAIYSVHSAFSISWVVSAWAAVEPSYSVWHPGSLFHDMIGLPQLLSW